MLDNNTYNLMMQLVEESKSAWRMRTLYEEEAAHCDECVQLWQRLLADKERNVDELERLVKSHLK